MPTFDAKTLGALRGAHEVAIRTEKHPATSVVIWVVVADDKVFVRSARGAAGRWYRDLLADRRATLDVAGRQVAVQAIPANATDSLAQASQAYVGKYDPSPYTQSVLKPDVVATTLRLEPR